METPQFEIRLTEEQLIKRVNGAPLTGEEWELLKCDCGLPHNKDIVLSVVMRRRAIALAWRKVMCHA